MDTTTRQRFWEIINDLKKSGVTILYSSHYIEEVEHTADRILVLHQGKLIRDTTPHAMRSEEKEKQVTLASRFAPSLDKLAAIYDVTEKRDVVTFMTKDIESVWSSLQAHGCRISDIEIQNKTLLDSLFDSTREDKS
ncbi:MAG: ABC transporter ATP-binding protein, partial [Streptococcus sp.]|nr:ABC transporter ATP-binding protein [Streptococcus sp.]